MALQSYGCQEYVDVVLVEQWWIKKIRMARRTGSNFNEGGRSTFEESDKHNRSSTWAVKYGGCWLFRGYWGISQHRRERTVRWLLFTTFTAVYVYMYSASCSPKPSISFSSTAIDMEAQLDFSAKLVGLLGEEARSEADLEKILNNNVDYYRQQLLSW